MGLMDHLGGPTWGRPTFLRGADFIFLQRGEPDFLEFFGHGWHSIVIAHLDDGMIFHFVALMGVS